MSKNLTAVLDASALLAFIKNENGSDTIKQIINSSVMTNVNVIETIVVLGRINPEKISHYHNLVTQIINHIYDCNLQLSLLVSEILVKYRKKHNISLGDSYCLALGKFLDLPIYTGDMAWSGLENQLGIKIEYIR